MILSLFPLCFSYVVQTLSGKRGEIKFNGMISEFHLRSLYDTDRVLNKPFFSNLRNLMKVHINSIYLGKLSMGR